MHAHAGKERADARAHSLFGARGLAWSLAVAGVAAVAITAGLFATTTAAAERIQPQMVDMMMGPGAERAFLKQQADAKRILEAHATGELARLRSVMQEVGFLEAGASLTNEDLAEFEADALPGLREWASFKSAREMWAHTIDTHTNVPLLTAAAIRSWNVVLAFLGVVTAFGIVILAERPRRRRPRRRRSRASSPGTGASGLA